MAQPQFWTGANGHTYVVTSGVAGDNGGGAQDYGILAPGANIAGAQRITDPNAPKSGPASTQSAGGSGGAAAPDLSSYDQSIGSTQAQLNNLVPGLNNGLQGVLSSYQTTINGLNQNKAQTDQQYNTTVTNNKQDYNSNKNAIRTQTGQTINNVNRLLSARGAAGQDAGTYAGLLAGQAGTQQLNGAGTTFGKNAQAVDTTYNNYVNTYNQNKDNAALERDNNLNSTKASYNTNRANLLQNLATLVNQRTSAAGGKGVAASQGYINEANSLMSEASRLGAPHPVAAQQALTYTAPTLEHYTANPTQVQAGATAGAAADSTLPFVAALQNRDKQLQQA